MNLIQQLKELRAKATQGEWYATGKYGHIEVQDVGSTNLVEIGQISDTFIFGNETERITKGTDNAEYIVALHNAFPQIIQEHEALLRFVDRVREMDNEKSYGDENGMGAYAKSWREQRDAALTALDKELKGNQNLDQ